jgi:hypothetical protein
MAPLLGPFKSYHIKYLAREVTHLLSSVGKKGKGKVLPVLELSTTP